MCPQRQYAPFRHRVDRIEDQVGQCLAQFALDSHHVGEDRRQFGVQANDDAALLRHIAPAGAGQVQHLLHHLVQVDRSEHQLRLARAIELAHAGHGRAHVVDGARDDL